MSHGPEPLDRSAPSALADASRSAPSQAEAARDMEEFEVGAAAFRAMPVAPYVGLPLEAAKRTAKIEGRTPRDLTDQAPAKLIWPLSTVPKPAGEQASSRPELPANRAI